MSNCGTGVAPYQVASSCKLTIRGSFAVCKYALILLTFVRNPTYHEVHRDGVSGRQLLQDFVSPVGNLCLALRREKMSLLSLSLVTLLPLYLLHGVVMTIIKTSAADKGCWVSGQAIKSNED